MNIRNFFSSIKFTNMNRIFILLIVIILYFMAMVLHDGYTAHIDFSYIWSSLIIFGFWGILITLAGFIGWNTLHWCCVPAYLICMIISILEQPFLRAGMPYVCIIMSSIILSFFVGIFLQIGKNIINRFTTSRQSFEVSSFASRTSLKVKYFKKIFIELPSSKDHLAYHQTLLFCLIIDISSNIAFVYNHSETTFLIDIFHCIFLTIVIGTIGYKGWKTIYTGGLIGIVMDGMVTITNSFFFSNPMKSLLRYLEYLLYNGLGASTMKIIWLIGINWFVVFGIVIGSFVKIIYNTKRLYKR
ncbi:hypothetical protein PPM_p0170 (plasmid) [Paenibacillus polymyxa M1]|uniref:hypothetical protein n=1 Tax=Paenibacillus polymyxa TaxID=1406 RepID=UPI00021BBB96|nr:hypothetical protein [Paenibacillus polymyxa]CCC86320.1 hypothetical protein PPM_p0170 [Paenibacillus polymyxa M1]